MLLVLIQNQNQNKNNIQLELSPMSIHLILNSTSTSTRHLHLHRHRFQALTESKAGVLSGLDRVGHHIRARSSKSPRGSHAGAKAARLGDARLVCVLCRARLCSSGKAARSSSWPFRIWRLRVRSRCHRPHHAHFCRLGQSHPAQTGCRRPQCSRHKP